MKMIEKTEFASQNETWCGSLSCAHPSCWQAQRRVIRGTSKQLTNLSDLETKSERKNDQRKSSSVSHRINQNVHNLSDTILDYSTGSYSPYIKPESKGISLLDYLRSREPMRKSSACHTPFQNVTNSASSLRQTFPPTGESFYPSTPGMDSSNQQRSAVPSVSSITVTLDTKASPNLQSKSCKVQNNSASIRSSPTSHLRKRPDVSGTLGDEIPEINYRYYVWRSSQESVSRQNPYSHHEGNVSSVHCLNIADEIDLPKQGEKENTLFQFLPSQRNSRLQGNSMQLKNQRWIHPASLTNDQSTVLLPRKTICLGDGNVVDLMALPSQLLSQVLDLIEQGELFSKDDLAHFLHTQGYDPATSTYRSQIDKSNQKNFNVNQRRVRLFSSKKREVLNRQVLRYPQVFHLDKAPQSNSAHQSQPPKTSISTSPHQFVKEISFPPLYRSYTSPGFSTASNGCVVKIDPQNVTQIDKNGKQSDWSLPSNNKGDVKLSPIIVGGEDSVSCDFISLSQRTYDSTQPKSPYILSRQKLMSPKEKVVECRNTDGITSEFESSEIIIRNNEIFIVKPSPYHPDCYISHGACQDLTNTPVSVVNIPPINSPLNTDRDTTPRTDTKSEGRLSVSRREEDNVDGLTNRMSSDLTSQNNKVIQIPVSSDDITQSQLALDSLPSPPPPSPELKSSQ